MLWHQVVELLCSGNWQAVDFDHSFSHRTLSAFLLHRAYRIMLFVYAYLVGSQLSFVYDFGASVFTVPMP